MGLVTAYHARPTPADYGRWITVKKANTAQPLDIVSDGSGGYCFRNVTGEYWRDDNHISPGFGPLHLLACAGNGSRGGDPWDHISDRPLDLRGGRLTVEVKAAHGLTLSQHASIIFWLQVTKPWSGGGFLTKLPTSPIVRLQEFVNIGYVGVNGIQTVDAALGYTHRHARTGPESRSTDWVRYEVPFSPDSNGEWVAYGGRKEKPWYALPESLEAVLARWDYNMGLHLVVGDHELEDYDPSVGHFLWRNFKLEVVAALNGLSG